MGELGRRLTKIERHLRRFVGRCTTCFAWPDFRVEYPADGPVFPDQRRHEQPPAACPDCEFRPDVIRIVYTDAWRPTAERGMMP